MVVYKDVILPTKTGANGDESDHEIIIIIINNMQIYNVLEAWAVTRWPDGVC